MNLFVTFIKGCAVIAAASLLCPEICASDTAQKPFRKKLIHAGWERPDSGDLLEHLQMIEKTPYDGVVLMLQGTDDTGKKVLLQNAFTSQPWRHEWFEKNIAELAQVRSSRLTDNFVRVSANPGNVDWFDDEGWKAIVDHWRIAARVAQQGGLKGICFDPEPYAKPHFQFSYKAQPGHAEHSFEEYVAKVRERGREVMNAVKGEYPGMTLFTFFMNSQNMRVLSADRLQGNRYNLYPAFINGWLDEAPPEMTFVDGNENAYPYDGELDYMRGANGMRNRALRLVAPENQNKYRLQVKAGFGIYLDAYTNPAGSKWYHGPLNGSRLARLQANTAYAMEAADAYVWTWGERYRWWPTKNPKVNPESWDDVLPGISNALMGIVDRDRLVEEAEQRFTEAESREKPKNLLLNGDFSATGPKATKSGSTAPRDWDAWKKTGETGTIILDGEVDRSDADQSGSARLAGMATRGSLGQTLTVQPGEIYHIRGWQRLTGASRGSIRVRWKDDDDRWVDEFNDVVLSSPASDSGEQEWQRLSGTALVPGAASRMVILLGASDQTSLQESIWYDDLEVFKID